MNFINKILCLLFGHKYILTQKLSKQSRRIACTRCKSMFAMNDDVKAVVPWDHEFHKLYESHGISIKYMHFEGTK